MHTFKHMSGYGVVKRSHIQLGDDCANQLEQTMSIPVGPHLKQDELFCSLVPRSCHVCVQERHDAPNEAMDAVVMVLPS